MKPPFHLAAGLSLEAASRVCSHECRAGCCRGPMQLRLTAPEVVAFRAHAQALGVPLSLHQEPEGSGSVLFPEHEGERCPMLDGDTMACRIYADRPERCRTFPDKPRPECAISGFTPDSPPSPDGSR